MNKSQRLFLGIFVLLLVDFIWVASSELTEYIFHEEKFEKPFFSTYLKTSLFSIFLLGFCVWPPWRDYCRSRPVYTYLDHGHEYDCLPTAEVDSTLSTPTYVPLRFHDGGEKGSGTESDDSSLKSVRFSKLAEVRHMSTSQAAEALLSRLSYEASVQAEESARRQANKLPLFDVIKLAFTFCFMWFVASYTYQLALAETEAAIVNVLSSSSSLFTLILAAIFPSNQGDKFTVSKFVAVLISLCGVVLVSMSDVKMEPEFPIGAIVAVVSAVFYACYIVFLRRKVDHEDKMDIPMFFAFVGLFNFILLWPVFFFLEYMRAEIFEWPSKEQWLYLVINGVVGTVVSEVLWLWGCFLTSSLVATLSLSLTIPMSMLADVVFKHVEYPMLFYVGSIPMFLAFFAVTLLAHYENWDPIVEMVKRMYYSCCYRRRVVRIRDSDREQTESLIGINLAEHEA